MTGLKQEPPAGKATGTGGTAKDSNSDSTAPLTENQSFPQGLDDENPFPGLHGPETATDPGDPPEPEQPPHPADGGEPPPEARRHGKSKKSPGKTRRFSLIRLSEIVTRPSDWLARDFLTTDCLAQLFSDPGSGKTFLAVAIACSVATGVPFYGRQVKQHPVIFIAGEGMAGLKKRFDAWSIRHQATLDDAPLFLSTGAAAFLDPDSVAAVLEAIDDTAQQHGPPGLIVIDTVARCFGPGDENATRDMSLFIQAVDQLREKYGASILLVHHSGHGDKSRGRGAMALKGALDFEFRLDRGDDDVVRLECTKIKDFERPTPMAFRLRTVELPLTDDEGKPVTSATFDAVDYAPPVRTTNAGRGKNQMLAIEALQGLFEDHRANLENDGRDPAGARVTVDEWKVACHGEGMNARRFRETRRSLESSGRVTVENGFVTPGHRAKQGAKLYRN